MNRRQWARRPGRSSTSWISKSTRFAIYHRDGFRCWYCSDRKARPAYDGVGLTLEHIEPRTSGGTHDPRNLVTACLRCNSSRQHRKHRRGEVSRLLKQASRPLNRGVGRLLAQLVRACRDHDLPHPLMLEIIGCSGLPERYRGPGGGSALMGDVSELLVVTSSPGARSAESLDALG